MRERLLETLNLPEELGKLTPAETDALAHEVRDLIVDVVSANGGHLAASLGVVELTLALLSVLDVPRDKIVWDVGHQCYAYKILTDRLARFPTLRKYGGISGFPKPSESCFDCFATGHASTAISAALGIATARDLAGENYRVVAVVGDGALGGGMAWEAMNHAGDAKADLLVILNDNRMSISPSSGALARHIARLRSMPLYRSVEDGAEKFFSKIPLGGGLLTRVGLVLKRGFTNWVSPTSGTIFEALGFEYLGPIDGHDFVELRGLLESTKRLKGPVLLHVVTTKGKGYHRAEHKPRAYHGVGPFNSDNGKASGKTRRTYTDVFGSALVKLAAKNHRIAAITAAMPDGTGLTRFAKKYPSRFFNVGIAEEHAVTFAAGLASAGAVPVVAIYSTFLQRAYDQIVHDVCLQNLPVVIAVDRAGIVGEDGPTHHGAFDISYLRHIPNLVMMAPRNAAELKAMLEFAVRCGKPVCLRYPRGGAEGLGRRPVPEIHFGESEVLCDGTDAAVLAVGPTANRAVEAADELAERGIRVRVINARFVKPLDEKGILAAARECGAIVVVEENSMIGGYASAVLECFASAHVGNLPIEVAALPDTFIGHGKASDLRERYGFTKGGIVGAVLRSLGKSVSDAEVEGDEIVLPQSI